VHTAHTSFADAFSKLPLGPLVVAWLPAHGYIYAHTTINGFGLSSQGHVLRVGCGGWWGYPGGLAAYARRFDFVEVNTTYYRLPTPETARGWRTQAGPASEFEFAVKAPRTLCAGEAGAGGVAEGEGARFFEVLSILEARFVVVHAPSGPGGAWVGLVERLADSGYTPVLTPPRRGLGVLRADGVRRGFPEPPRGLASACVYAWDPVLEEPPPTHVGYFYARVFGVPVGVAHHLGGGMVSLAACRLRVALTRGGVRVAVHTYRAPEDALRIMRSLTA